MKIAFFTNTYLPNIYGLTTSIESFRRGLEELGHEVYIFAPKVYGYQDKNKNVFRYPALRWKYKIDYSLPISFYPPINKLIDGLNLDIIHVHQPFSIAKDGLRQAQRLGIPCVFTNHTRYEDYVHYVPLVPKNFLRWYVTRQATKFANNCDQVITPSREIKELIIQNGVKTPIEVLSTGIDAEFLSCGNRNKIREKYGLAVEDICLLWLGRIEKEKNLGFLFDFIIDILKDNSNVKLLIVGEGSERKKYEKIVKENKLENQIIFIGLIAQQNIHDYYCAGDIFLQTSITETQGLATTEALAAGLAIIAIKATGTSDLIENNKTGILVENNKEEFKSALISLLNDKEKIKLLAKAAKEEAKMLDYKEKTKKLMEIYRQVLNKFPNK